MGARLGALCVLFCAACGGTTPPSATASTTTTLDEPEECPGGVSSDGDCCVNGIACGAACIAAHLECHVDDESEPPAPLTITAIDVGQGDCTFVRCPNGSTILVDCGSIRNSVRGTNQRAEVVGLIDGLLGDDDDVDVLVVTHPDRDHYNYLEDVIGSRSSMLLLNTAS